MESVPEDFKGTPLTEDELAKIEHLRETPPEPEEDKKPSQDNRKPPIKVKPGT